MVGGRKLSPAEREAHRRRNREGMRKTRQRQRQRILEMEGTAQQLEKRYAELYQRSTNAAQDAETSASSRKQTYIDAVSEAKRLGAENLLVQSVLKRNLEWQRQLQRILDFEESNLHSNSSIAELGLDVLDEGQAEKEFGFHRLTEWDLTQLILDNKRNIHHVEIRLLHSTMLHDRVHAFGWEIVQCVEGGVMEFVFTKKFAGLNILEVMQATWSNDMQLERFRKVKAETLRLQIVQHINSNASVLVRDVASPSDISIFRSVFARFLVEATREFSFSANDSVTGTGYVLGTHSVRTDRTCRLSEEELCGKMAWADLVLSIGAFEVVEPSTCETYQIVRWAGRTDYCNEEHAQRNASDTLQGMLRWEMLVIAPVLNLVFS